MTHFSTITLTPSKLVAHLVLDDGTQVYLCPSQVKSIARQQAQNVAFPRVEPHTNQELMELLKSPEFAGMDS